jgi:hypothetical protein
LTVHARLPIFLASRRLGVWLHNGYARDIEVEILNSTMGAAWPFSGWG